MIKDTKVPLSYAILLDDLRTPEQVYEYTKNPIYLNKKWRVVKNYSEFVSLLELINIEGSRIASVSLDHDLQGDHYSVPFETWETYTADQLGMEETGLDCAKYLTQFIDDNKMAHPGITCHSMNPVGKERINQHLLDWMNLHGGDEE